MLAKYTLAYYAILRLNLLHVLEGKLAKNCGVHKGIVISLDIQTYGLSTLMRTEN